MPLSLRGTTIRNRTQVASGFTPATLFSNNEQGAWYDPSDFDTMFQDVDGNTRVTATGQSVALIFDKSRNLSRGSEFVTNSEFDSGTTGWTTDVAGSLSASGGVLTITNPSASYSSVYQQLTVTANKWYVCTFRVKAGTSSIGCRAERTLYGNEYGNQSVNNAASYSSVSIYAYATTTTLIVRCNINNVAGNNAFIDSISVREVLGNHAYQSTAANRPTLQQDSNGKYYLDFDGTNDSLVTNSVNFTGTDKMTVFAGVTKNSDAAIGMLCELSTQFSANAGTFALLLPPSVSATNVTFYSSGTTFRGAIAEVGAAPVSRVITGIGDISGDNVYVRVNGVSGTPVTGDQGTGNYGNYPLYIGARAGTNQIFSGRLYALLIRGAAITDSNILNSAERWVAARTGVTW